MGEVEVSIGAMIVLINPRASVEVVEKLDLSTPPLGLGYLASSLREAGFKVRIIDDAVEKLSPERLIDRIRDAFLVGITSTTPTFRAALRYARMIKRALPDVFVMMGGVHATLRPYDALREESVDAVCLGEGEQTIVEVAERIESGRSLEEVRGVIYRDGRRIVENQPREFIEDLDSLPFPAFDLMPLEKYTLLGRKLNHFPMITSRGCPFRCRFCSSSLFMGGRFRARSPRNVVDEMEWLVDEFGARSIAFGDDTFTLDRKRVEEICREIRERRLDISWSCSSRVDTIDEDLMRKMRDAGCRAIYFGIESASERILGYYRKRIRLEKAIDAVRIAKKLGITTICSFIIGAPDETPEEMMETLRFALKLDPDYAQFSILTPYPGTEIHEEARRRGLLLTENYDEYTAGRPVLRNLYMRPEDISRFLRYCYVRFYLRPRFILRELRKGNVRLIVDVVRRWLRR